MKTDRLAVVTWRPEDALWLRELHGDPAVQRYIDRAAAPWPDEVLERKLAAWIEHGARFGYTKWKVVERASGSPVGRAGLETMDGSGETELGFSFVRSAWGRGFATEVGGALIRWAFAETPLDVVHGFAHAENTASRRVLEKLGMTRCGRRHWNGMPTVVYAVSRGEADIIWPRERHRNAPRP